jgi:hypothetical protein
MNKKYKDIGKPSMRVIEECSELIKAIIKAERFGYSNSHPDNFPCHSRPKENWCDNDGPGGFMGHTCGKVKTNMDEIMAEFSDLVLAWGDFIKSQG